MTLIAPYSMLHKQESRFAIPRDAHLDPEADAQEQLEEIQRIEEFRANQRGETERQFQLHLFIRNVGNGHIKADAIDGWLGWVASHNNLTVGEVKSMTLEELIFTGKLNDVDLATLNALGFKVDSSEL